MKTNKILLFLLVVMSMVSLTSFNSDSGIKATDNTSGTVVFTAKTLPAGGNYAPKHVLAIWVEKDGVFVKTRKAMANQRKQYLYKWAASSNYNVTDAITGATLPQHQTHTIEWNCKDLSGNVVPDGNYTVIIEFTDKHAQGPYYEVTFNKGTEPVSITPPNQQYIINMQLTYTPEITVTANFAANITEACPEEEIIFTDNSTGATTWLWNFGEGSTPATASTQGPHTVSYSTPGAKTVSLTVNGSSTETKTDYIAILPAPVAGFTFDLMENAASFTNTSQNATSYLWDFGDGNTSTEVNPTHVYWENGEFTVTLTATSDNCGNDTFNDVVVIVGVGVDEPEQAIMDVYPNPSSGSFNLNFGKNIEYIKVSLFDIQGRLLLSEERANTPGAMIFPKSDQLLKPGVYFLDLTSGSKSIQKKLIVK